MQKVFDKFENWFYQQSIQRNLLVIGFGIVFILIFALNYYFPIYADDMMYSVVKYQESVHLLDNLKEIGEFIHYYFFNWGGRVVAHIIAHVLLLFNPFLQDLFNTLAFCLLVYFTYKLSTVNRNNFYLFVLIALSIFYFTPSFLSSAIWKTGSANYLWTLTSSLGYLYYYLSFYRGKEYNDNVARGILIFLFGIIVGCTNENLGPILFLMVATLIYCTSSYKKRLIPRWTILGLIGVIIGCGLMILAPGNAVRAELEGYPSLFNSFGAILDRLSNIYASYRYFMSRLIFLYILTLVGNYYYPKNIDKRKDLLFQSILFFVAANIGIWITLLSPTFPPRAFMSVTVLTIVAIGIMYGNIDFRKMLPRVLNIGLLVGLLFLASVDYFTFLRGLYFLDGEMKNREAVIDRLKEKGIREATFEKIYMDYRFEYTDFDNYYKDYYDMDVLFLEKGDPRLEDANNEK